MASAPSGKYDKGVRRQEAILDMALPFIAEHGYNQATVRELADAVGISKTGLMHHFESKEALFAEVLRRRDTVDEISQVELAGGRLEEGLPASFARGVEVPGLVQLYARFSAEATTPDHRAHEYFVDRFDRARGRLGESIRDEQGAGRIREDVDAEVLATAVLAAMDGLQVQWLFNPQLDIVGALSTLLHAMVWPDDVAGDS